MKTAMQYRKRFWDQKNSIGQRVFTDTPLRRIYHFSIDQPGPRGILLSFTSGEDAIKIGRELLMHSAGNFYINDKPTGAVVGQQPFGGSRASGTNDKAGAPANLLRWTSQRTVKETFDPPVDYRYPFMEDE